MAFKSLKCSSMHSKGYLEVTPTFRLLGLVDPNEEAMNSLRFVGARSVLALKSIGQKGFRSSTSDSYSTKLTT